MSEHPHRSLNNHPPKSTPQTVSALQQADIWANKQSPDRKKKQLKIYTAKLKYLY